MHPHTIIATVLGCGVIAVVAFVRPRVEEVIVGDWPRLPREFEQRAAKDSPGGGAGYAARALDGRTHRERGK